jgi:hypothetical protein
MIVNNFPMGVKIYTDQIINLASSYVARTPDSISLTWTNPASSKFVGVMIRYKVGSYPTSPTDGTQAYFGTGTSAVVTGLTAGTLYYFRAFAKATSTDGSKVYYNTDTTSARTTNVTVSNPITNLVIAKVSTSSLSASWTAPVGNYSGVMVRYKAGSYPISGSDGTLAYDGTGTSVTVTGLTAGTTYYFRAFVRNSNSVYNNNDVGQQAYNNTKVAAGQVVFTTSQIWTVPDGLESIDIFGVGAGEGGGTCDSNSAAGAGGGSGYTATRKAYAVTPGQQFAIVIGAGGTGVKFVNGQITTTTGGAGGNTSFGSVLTAMGASVFRSYIYGGDGGSGGGASAFSDTGRYYGGYGGTNGGNGGAAGGDSSHAGVGQGTTTRAFGETSNTLYAGAGGGGGMPGCSGGTAGAGGGGAGGAGGSGTAGSGGNGTPNTGGGAGGGGANTIGGNGGNGGSGVLIVRWAEQ